MSEESIVEEKKEDEGKKEEIDKVEDLLNPECKILKIGVKKTEDVIVYPLSYYEQKKTSEMVAKKMQTLSTELNDDKEVAFIGKLAQVLESSIPTLVKSCTDLEPKYFMKHVTAGQLMEFINIIMEVNFLNPIQKGTDLFVNMGSLYGMNPSSPMSANNMDTESLTSENQ